MPKKDLTGQKFGRLTVLGEAGRANDGKVKWLCRCDCGSEKVISGRDITYGKTKSCGCLKREFIPKNKINLIGQRFARLAVVEESGRTSDGKVKWLCKCDCGRQTFSTTANLRSGNSKSCGCLQRENASEVKKVDMIGLKFSRLTIMKEDGRTNAGMIKWLCKCDCGNMVSVSGASLRTGDAKSCGCLHLEVRTKHGLSRSYLYKTWRGIIARCCDRNHEAFHNYGGRGIKVHPDWLGEQGCINFHNYVEDFLGPKPSKNHEIDRIDNDGNYEPGNIQWLTRKENSRKRRNSALTIELVEYIREQKDLGRTYVDIAKELKLNKVSVAKAGRGQTWT